MDFVPKERRAKWKALESIGSLGWSGSAVLGGWLADKYDYSTTFLITIGFQLIGACVHLTMINVVPKDEKKTPRKSTVSKGDGSVDAAASTSSVAADTAVLTPSSVYTKLEEGEEGERTSGTSNDKA
jgi:hypothetical protein